MKVLFLMPHLSAMGAGVTRSTYDLLPALHALGVEPSVVCLRDAQPSMRERFEERGTPVAVLPRGKNAWVRALRKIARHQKTDVLHTAKVPTSVIGRLASVGLPVSVVTSLVNTEKPERRRSQLAYRWTGRLTDHFHAVSFAAKDYATRELGIPDGRITVIERGRDAARLGSPSTERRMRGRAALGIDVKVPVILTAGRQEPSKDQATLIAAFERLASSNPDALLLIAGREGGAASLLRQRCDVSRHGDRIRILGHREDLPDLMAAADVFAIPSHSEGFSGTTIEAMALGLPVVASDIPPLREAVVEGVTGSFARLGYPDEFADALEALVRDPQRARALGANGRRRFLELYTIERSAERVRDLYAEVVARAPAGPGD